MKLTCAAAAALVLCLGAVPAQAQQTPAQRAEQLNNEGKEFFRTDDYAAAADKFRQAAVLSPEGRFYFNLCYTLDKIGKYRDALMACQAVEPNGASIPLQDKANELMAAIRGKLGNQGGGEPDGPDVGGGADPDDPNLGGGYQGDGGPPPPGGGPVIEQPAPRPDDYAWSVGGEFGVLSNGLGNEGTFDESGVILKLFVNFLVAQEQRIGLQGYLNFSQIGDGAEATPLEVVDVGGALFKHFPLGGGSFVFTPLAGVHLGLMRPSAFADDDTAVAVGLRADVQLAWLLGRYNEHQISASLGLNAYSGASSGNFDPMFYGLHKGGATFGLTFGYTYRFSTPFGQSPVFTLE